MIWCLKIKSGLRSSSEVESSKLLVEVRVKSVLVASEVRVGVESHEDRFSGENSCQQRLSIRDKSLGYSRRSCARVGSGTEYKNTTKTNTTKYIYTAYKK